MKSSIRNRDLLKLALAGICLIGILLAGCSAPRATEAPAAEAPAAEQPTSAPAEAAPAAAPFTAQVPALAGTPIAAPDRAINVLNASAIAQLAVWGKPDFTQADSTPPADQTQTGGIEEIHRLPSALAFSPDNQLLAVGTQGGLVELWWLTDGVMARQFGGDNVPITHLAYAQNGSQIASGNVNGAVQLWSPGDGGLLMELPGHKAAINGLAFSPNDDLIAASADDGTVLVWALPAGNQVAVLEGDNTARPAGLAFNPDGTLLAVALENGSLHVWQTADWSLIGEYPTGIPLNGAAFSPVSPYKLVLTSLNGELLVWDIGSGGLQSGFVPGGGGLIALTLSPAGDLAAAASAGGIHLADLINSRSTRLPGSREHQPLALAFSPDGYYLASAGADGTVRIWGVPPR